MQRARSALKFHEFWLEARVHNSNRERALPRNGNARSLMVARVALRPAVDCQIIDNTPKPTRSCAGARASGSGETASAYYYTRRWRDSQQLETRRSTLARAPIQTFIGPRLAHLHARRTPGSAADQTEVELIRHLSQLAPSINM